MFVNARRVLAIVAVSFSAFVGLTANATAAKEVEYEMCGQSGKVSTEGLILWNCGEPEASHFVVYKGLYTNLSEYPHGTGYVTKEKGGRIRFTVVTPTYLQGSYWQFEKAGMCQPKEIGCFKHAYILESGVVRRERGFDTDEWEEEPIPFQTVLLRKIS